MVGCSEGLLVGKVGLKLGLIEGVVEGVADDRKAEPTSTVVALTYMRGGNLLARAVVEMLEVIFPVAVATNMRSLTTV